MSHPAPDSEFTGQIRQNRSSSRFARIWKGSISQASQLSPSVFTQMDLGCLQGLGKSYSEQKHTHGPCCQWGSLWVTTSCFPVQQVNHVSGHVSRQQLSTWTFTDEMTAEEHSYCDNSWVYDSSFWSLSVRVLERYYGEPLFVSQMEQKRFLSRYPANGHANEEEIFPSTAK